MPNKYAEQSVVGHLPGPIVKFTIGADPARDYAECSDFTAAFTNTLIPDPYTSVIVEFYNDSGTDQAAFTTPFIISSMPSNCGALLVTVHDDHWHKGDPTKGCALKIATTSSTSRMSIAGTVPKKVERLVFNANGLFSAAGLGIIDQPTSVDTARPSMQWYDQCIVTGGDTPNPGRYIRGIDSSTRPMQVTNCLVYNIVCNGAASSSASYGIGGDDKMNIVNCTIDNVDFQNHSGSGNYGIDMPGAGFVVRDNIVTNTDIGYDMTATSVNNIAEDATGTTTSTAATEFVDAANNDYTLNSGAAAAGSMSVGRFGTDVTGAIRDATVAGDAGAFNNVAGYEQEAATGGGGSTTCPKHPLARF